MKQIASLSVSLVCMLMTISACAQESQPVKSFAALNVYVVHNSPTCSATFTANQPVFITHAMPHRWNDGQGTRNYRTADQGLQRGRFVEDRRHARTGRWTERQQGSLLCRGEESLLGETRSLEFP